MQRTYRISALLIVIALVLACAPTLAPEATQSPAFDPNSINTAIVLTADSAATQTAILKPATLTPSVTSFPTSTLPASETSTPTFIFILATSTVPSSTPTAEPTQDGSSSTSQYACRVDSKNPADDTVYAPGTNFEASWEVKNTGNGKWESDSADYRYVSGDKFHQASIYDFNKSVGVGKSTVLIASMKAPGSPGTYSTTWKIFIGKKSFCAMNITIIVK